MTDKSPKVYSDGYEIITVHPATDDQIAAYLDAERAAAQAEIDQIAEQASQADTLDNLDNAIETLQGMAVVWACEAADRIEWDEGAGTAMRRAVAHMQAAELALDTARARTAEQ